MVLYAGREDVAHWEYVGLLLSKEATKALKEWKPVNSRITTTHFVTNFAKVSFSVLCANKQQKRMFQRQFLLIAEPPLQDPLICHCLMEDQNAQVGGVNTDMNTLRADVAFPRQMTMVNVLLNSAS
ncbi:hypothetical protein KIL84_001276 [Mauremys mutica]|uniref:Uncharacterized protein n=1 Tax=Mauremys mutica TaxID=74926 RepID=A0A9D3WZZ9_9SAUR|nr:hypothetical protein KIL84_001276 [Mauremys mutica]